MAIHSLIFSVKLRIYAKNIKERRSIVKSLINELQKKYNISIIELRIKNHLKYIALGISSISENRNILNNLQENILMFLETKDFFIEDFYKELI